jgi:hypothetical protein
VFERTPIARQTAASPRRSRRRTRRSVRQRGWGFDVCGGRLHEADCSRRANALAVDPAADADFRRQRANRLDTW